MWLKEKLPTRSSTSLFALGDPPYNEQQAREMDESAATDAVAAKNEEKDWAAAFAIPGDWPGLKQGVHIHKLRERTSLERGFVPGGTDSYMIFEDCFVPWDRVFLCGESQLGGVAALLFALIDLVSGE